MGSVGSGKMPSSRKGASGGAEEKRANANMPAGGLITFFEGRDSQVKKSGTIGTCLGGSIGGRASADLTVYGILVFCAKETGRAACRDYESTILPRCSP